MMKPSIPKGTRDFLPEQVNKRNYIFETIKQVFQTYGYLPIETPSMENLETLTGKYGEEGDQLLFKVLNNGDFLRKANAEALEEKDSTKLLPSISKRGMRYDLTVPFARFVVMHQNELAFPFKRYQIQPVWRADRPQKGRYQEFYQCDADVVGSDSLMYEAELVKIYDQVFANLGLNVVIQVNNRKVLFGIAEAVGITEQFMPMTIAIDKLDKIGEAKVIEEMARSGISQAEAKEVLQILQMKDLEALEQRFSEAPEGLKGIAELRTFHKYLDSLETTNTIAFDISLARGLNYYTGCIFEVKVDTAKYPDVKMGSVGGGGRYADLTGVFGMKDMSGVGISFGAARIFDVMEELALFPAEVMQDLDLLAIAFDDESHAFAFKMVGQLRNQGIKADLYPEPAKMKKQMKYADARQVPYTLIIGSEEISSGKLSMKNMQTGEQEKLTIAEIIAHFTK